MSKGKYSKKHSFSIRPIVLLLTVALLIGGTIGGTIAWLTATTQDVTNTFTVGDVNITLMESKINVADNGTVTYADPAPNVTSQYPLIPGTTYKKDPYVAVVNSDSNVVSEDCYLFVKFVETEKAKTYLDYTSTLTTENGWTKGNGTDIPSDVWYREVKKTDTTKSWYLLQGKADNDLLKNGYITIRADAVTKSTMTEAANQSLTYTAYAIQKANINTPAAAWEQISKSAPTGGNAGSGDAGTN